MTPLILASSSPYRKALLERLALPFQSCSPEVDESPLASEEPRQLTLRLSKAKALAVAEQFGSHLIIGSDQVAECNNDILCKPGNFDNARQQLQQQSGNSIVFHTGLCVLNSVSGQCELDVVTTTVHFRQLSDQEIERYLHKERPYDCAGSFKSEDMGISLLNGMDGTDPSALIGLPLIRLCEMLRRQGMQLP